MDTLLRDLRFALRALLKHPTVFAVAVLSLALGIAANTTIFAAIDAYLIRPIPVPAADRIMQIWSTNPERGWRQSSISPPDYLDWVRESRTIELAASTGGSVNLAASGDRPERVVGARVTPSYFRVFAFRPVVGRAFLDDEARKGSDRSVILSHQFWERRFAGDRSVVGRTLLLNGESHTVVGVMPKDMKFPATAIDIWRPLAFDGTEKRGDRYLEVVGKLRPPSTVASARGELEAIAKRLAAAYPADNRGMGATVIPIADEIYDDTFHQGATISMVAVAFVLLIACSNVANLLLARAMGRARELALRTAIGASRARLVRQLLTESVVLALAGGVLGVLLSIAGIKGLMSIIPHDFYRSDTVALNGRALVFTLVISVASGILFGLAPAFAATGELGQALREGGRSSSMGLRRNRLGASFVVAEMALALVLLICAGLLIKGAIRYQTVDLGFDPNNLLTLRVSLPESQYTDSIKSAAFHEELLRRLRGVPGVQAVGATTNLPMDGATGTYYWIDGEPKPEAGKARVSQYRGTSPGYFATMRIPLVRGRDFTERDRVDAPLVVLVNEAFVRRHWKGDASGAIGRRIVVSDRPREIVGVVKDARDFGPDDDTPTMFYIPSLQRGHRNLSYALRSSRDPGGLADAVRAELAAIDASLPAYSVRTMREIIREEQAGDMIMPKLLTAFGAIALFLAVIGVYGVMAYTVSQRTQEVGIRMALGAQRADILRMVVRQGLTLAAIGLGIGLLLSFGATRGLSSFLLGVSAFDPVVFVGVTAALGAAAVAASWGPARRAMKVDPLVALRYD
ncbi:MAG: ABC transporter permease [Gemmatimonadaceae bacterium]